MRRRSLGLLVLAACWPFWLATGCASDQLHPEIDNSGDRQGYAGGYPEALAAAKVHLLTSMSDANQIIGHFALYPAELKKPYPQLALEIVVQADGAGRSSAYADKMRAEATVNEFFDDEKDTLTRRVTGAVQKTLHDNPRQCGECPAEFGGGVAYALRDGIDKQLEKRRRARNDAQVMLARERAGLGKEAAGILEHWADEIGYASYLVHVDVVESRDRLRMMVDQRREVERAMDRFVEDEKDYLAKRAKTDGDRRGAEERIAAMTRNKAMVATAAAEGDKVLEGQDDRIRALRKAYEDALRTLKEKVRAQES